jgi:hypothetical protein
MSVVVNEARRNRQTAGVNGLRRALSELTHFDNFAVLDADIRDIRRQPGTIDDATTANQ